MLSGLFYILLFLISLFIILLVLVQKGKGGGLAGAFGGQGGQSVFGSKAGDLFTRITIGAALIWIVLCITATLALSDGSMNTLGDGNGKADSPAVVEMTGDGLNPMSPAAPTDNADAPAAAAANTSDK